MISLKELSNNAVLNFEAELKNKSSGCPWRKRFKDLADKYRIDQVLMNLMSNAINIRPGQEYRYTDQ